MRIDVFGMTPTHDGRLLLVTHPSSDSVSILNLRSMKIERVIRVPAEPQEILDVQTIELLTSLSIKARKWLR
jgi:hypothetical protein